MVQNKSFYVTTPIYYVNDKPHIGHAYTSLAADAIARFKRLDGYDVHFLTGTDEHGQKVEKSALKAQMSPKEFTDRLSQTFSQLADDMNYTHNDFIRTTQDRHKKACQALWNQLIDQGDIYLGSYAGWYCVRDEAYFSEKELVKKGDEYYAPSGAQVSWVEEPSYFFALSKWQQPLLDYYHQHQDFIAPKSRRNEVISFVEQGLEDLSISRTSFNWGVGVPENSQHIMYVWLDALTNYLTSLGYPNTEEKSYQKFWPADLHIVGKDILRFHAVYWPAFLMSAKLKLPERIFAHGWWTNNGEKISKSLGNTVDPYQLIDQYGLDQMRYFLLREVPFGNDANFSHEVIKNRINADLANDFGNLCQRVFSMIVKNCDHQIPDFSDILPEDESLLTQAKDLISQLRTCYDQQSFDGALKAQWDLCAKANRYVDDMAPWTLKKTNPERMKTVLYVLSQVIVYLAIYAQPVMPMASKKILDFLNIPEKQRNFLAIKEGGNLPQPHTHLNQPEPIFPRYED